jgi:hypothetical protein
MDLGLSYEVESQWMEIEGQFFILK